MNNCNQSFKASLLSKEDLDQCSLGIAEYSKKAKKIFHTSEYELLFGVEEKVNTKMTFEERSTSAFLKDHAQKVWEDAWVAKEKMNFGMYHLCSRCFEEIGKERLLKFPIAIYCKYCEEKRAEDREELYIAR